MHLALFQSQQFALTYAHTLNAFSRFLLKLCQSSVTTQEKIVCAFYLAL